jgi:hypothetical protein
MEKDLLDIPGHIAEHWARELGKKIDERIFKSFAEKLKYEEKDADIVLLVDGDIVAYRASAAANGKRYKIKQARSGYYKQDFKYKKEAVDYCWKKKIDLSRIEAVIEPEPLSHALHNVKSIMTEIISKMYNMHPGKTMKTEVYLTGNLNFRKEFSDTYKEHRKKTDEPVHLNECKQYLLTNWDAVLEEGLEADDLIGIAAMKYREGESTAVMCSPDKDFNCVPGWHFDWTKDKYWCQSEFDSIRFFYEQCIIGDKADNIAGLFRYGPMKAEKILDSVEPSGLTPVVYEKKLFARVLAEYFAVTKKDYRKAKEMKKSKRIHKGIKINLLKVAFDSLTLNARLLWILREPFVMWEPPIARELLDVLEAEWKAKGEEPGEEEEEASILSL